MCFKNPFKDKDDICFFAAIICTAIANGVAVGLPKSNILGLTAILAFALKASTGVRVAVTTISSKKNACCSSAWPTVYPPR